MESNMNYKYLIACPQFETSWFAASWILKNPEYSETSKQMHPSPHLDLQCFSPRLSKHVYISLLSYFLLSNFLYKLFCGFQCYPISCLFANLLFSNISVALHSYQASGEAQLIQISCNLLHFTITFIYNTTINFRFTKNILAVCNKTY